MNLWILVLIAYVGLLVGGAVLCSILAHMTISTYRDRRRR